MKLTPAQVALLRDVCERRRYVADYYPPARVLVKTGLCDWSGSVLFATEKGRAELARREGNR